MWVCPSDELTVGTGGISRGRPGETTCGDGGKRTRLCGLLAPGKVILFGLPRCVTSLGLAGLTPGGYPPTWPKASPPHARSIVAAEPIAFMVRLIRSPDVPQLGLSAEIDIGRQPRRHNSRELRWNISAGQMPSWAARSSASRTRDCSRAAGNM